MNKDSQLRTSIERGGAGECLTEFYRTIATLTPEISLE